MEDIAIVSLFEDRNELAIKYTEEKYGKRLFQLAKGIVCDHETAEECENDTYLQAWNSIPPNKPYDYLYAFLARITRHLSLNCCRERNTLKRKAFVTELTEEMEQCIPGKDDFHIDEIVLQELLNRFLGSLKPERRKIFLRRYWYMDSVSEVAKFCGVSESKVKTTLFRTRAELYAFLEKEGYRL